MQDYKSDILTHLRQLQQEAYASKSVFRAKAYGQVIAQLTLKTGQIQTFEDLADIKGIGKSIHAQIESILDGTVKINVHKKNDQEVIAQLCEITAIGPVTAKKLVTEHGIRNVDDLRNHTELLNEKQRIGLQYYGDILERIPRWEMDRHMKFLKKAAKAVSPTIQFEIAGSYRRGEASSGDIDVLITHETDDNVLEEFINYLKTKKYLKDDFAQGSQKYMGICCLPTSINNRRIDILFIPRNRFAFALLYFTGSKNFNVRMRQHALDQGYSLNEHGLTSLRTKKEVTNRTFHSEEDIFKFLKYPFSHPEDRSV